jgi:Uma2 family endonuclease
VGQAWLINPLQHTLEVLRLSSETPGQWMSLAVFKHEDHVRADPFAAIELELAALWQNVEP